MTDKAYEKCLKQSVCPICSFELEKRATVFVARELAEKVYWCPDCDRKVGFWAYGSFQPKKYFDLTTPKK
jgi:uncharacterized protein with PIN domain